MVKKICILTGGGTTCVLNRSIEVVRNVGRNLGYIVFGIIGGYKGCIGSRLEEIDITNAEIPYWQSGSILKTSRTNPAAVDKKGKIRLEQVINNLKNADVDVFVPIGGEDTLGAALVLNGINVLGFPKTVDNDLMSNAYFEGYNVNLCPGFMSGARKLNKIAQNLRIEAESTDRIFVMEVMGRKASYLACSTMIGDEKDPDFIFSCGRYTNEDLRRFLDKVQKRYDERGNVVIVVPEGIEVFDEKKGWISFENEKRDEFGHGELGGSGNYIRNLIEKETNLQCRSEPRSYAPRIGEPHIGDLALVDSLGEEFKRLLEDGKFGYYVSVRCLKIPNEIYTGSLSFHYANSCEIPIDFYNFDDFSLTEDGKRFMKFIWENAGEAIRQNGD